MDYDIDHGTHQLFELILDILSLKDLQTASNEVVLNVLHYSEVRYSLDTAD